MKLRSIHEEVPVITRQPRKGYGPTLTIKSRDGKSLFQFSKSAYDHFGMQKAQDINIWYDEDTPSDLYLELIPKGAGAYGLRFDENKGTLLLQDINLCTWLLKKIGLGEGNFQFLLAKENVVIDGRTCIVLITKSARLLEKKSYHV